MKNYSLFLFVAFAIMLTACNKHDASKARVKKMTSSRGLTIEYFYGPDGNVTHSISEGTRTTYKFEPTKITQEVNDSLRHMSATSYVYLDSKGFADSTVADENAHYVKTYVHDANGYIVASNDIVGGSTMRMTTSVIKDGNTATTTFADSTGKPMVNVIIEYMTDKPNTLAYENFGMKFYGMDSKNLMKQFAQVLPAGDTMRINKLNYHWDKEGRVTDKVMYDARSGQMIDSSTFTYY